MSAPATSPSAVSSTAPAPAAPGTRHVLVALSGLLMALFVAILSSTIVSNALPRILADLGGSQAAVHVGGHGLAAGDDRLDADLGQARRPLLEEAARPDRDHGLHRRLDALRPHHEHRGAHRLPRPAGARHGRAHGPGPGRDRGDHPAARARPVLRLPRRDHGRGDGRRPAHRRRHRRQHRLALVLLRHRPDRRGRPRRPAAHADGADGPARGAHRLPRRGPHRRRRLDPAVWTSLAGKQFAWGSWASVAWVGGGVLALVLAVVVESRVREPIVPLHLFRNRTVALATVASLCVGVAMFGSTVFLSQYFQLARGASPTEAGLLTLPMIVGLFLASTVVGQLITRYGRWKPYLVGGGVLLTVRAPRRGTPRQRDGVLPGPRGVHGDGRHRRRRHPAEPRARRAEPGRHERDRRGQLHRRVLPLARRCGRRRRARRAAEHPGDDLDHARASVPSASPPRPPARPARSRTSRPCPSRSGA